MCRSSASSAERRRRYEPYDRPQPNAQKPTYAGTPSHKTVLDLPQVIEHMPGDTADKVTRGPGGATTRPARR